MADTERLLALGLEVRGGMEGDHLWAWPGNPDLMRESQALELLAEQDEEGEDR